jgi:hypothetical protein
MTDDELTQYRKARPYIRAILAILFYLCKEKGPGTLIGYYFTLADSFLTEFEMWRNS